MRIFWIAIWVLAYQCYSFSGPKRRSTYMAKTRTNIDDHEVVIDMVYIEERSGTPLFWVIYGIFQSLFIIYSQNPPCHLTDTTDPYSQHCSTTAESATCSSRHGSTCPNPPACDGCGHSRRTGRTVLEMSGRGLAASTVASSFQLLKNTAKLAYGSFRFAFIHCRITQYQSLRGRAMQVVD